MAAQGLLTANRSSSINPDVLRNDVESKTYRQVQDLEIDCSDDGITVTGHSRSYYIKQLVTQAIRSHVPSAPLRNEIVVAYN